MKLLLLGGNGQLGRELRRSLAPLGEVVVATRHGQCDGAACEQADLDAPAQLAALVARVAPDVVVNAAAYTAVDRAEDDAAAALRANAEAPRALAAACAAGDALLLHYSTDYVFDGRATRPYREDDATAPLGVYGASKLAGEQAIAASGARHVILRTAWVYAAHGHNFLLTMLRLARERDELRVVADQTGTPTSAALIADASASVIAAPWRGSGLWHVTAGGATSWHGFAEAILHGARQRGLLHALPRLLPIASGEFPARARRPAYSCLDTRRLQATFGIEPGDWRTHLAAVLDELAAGGHSNQAAGSSPEHARQGSGE